MGISAARPSSGSGQASRTETRRELPRADKMMVKPDLACTMALAASSVTTRAASSARSAAPQSRRVATAKWRAAAGASREKG